MAKALELDAEILNVVPPVPKAAQAGSQFLPPQPKVESRQIEERREPLQVRWPSRDVKAAKLAAIEQDFPTVSEFMLACFHAYMKSGKQA